MLLRPLPVSEQERLLVVRKSLPARGFDQMPFTFAGFEEMRERLRTVSGAAAHPYHGASLAVLTRDGQSLPLRVAGVTGDWFAVLGVRPRLGRLLEAADDRIGVPPVLMLSSPAARRLFGSESAAIGRTVRVNETTFTIVGLAPPDFEFPAGTEAWAPATALFLPAVPGATSLRDADKVAWNLVVRVADGFTMEQTRRELDAALATLPSESLAPSEQQIRAQPFADVLVGEARPALLMLAAAVVLVLLVAGANLANLLLVRGLTRQRELAVRIAVGAGRGDIVRLILRETTLLVALGAVGGTLVAFVALRALLALAPPELPHLARIGLDARAIGFTVILALALALIFGLVPALRTARASLGRRIDLRERMRAPTGHRLRHALVTVQIAITVLVLSMAGLLLRSLERMRQLDVGFEADGILLAYVTFPPSRFPLESDHQQAMVRLARRVAQLPGVTRASAIVTSPFAGNGGVDAIWYAEGQTRDAASNPYANYEGVDAAHFMTLQLPIRHGRGIEEQDRAGSQPVVVVNEAFAQLYWPEQDAVGRRIKLGGADSPDPWRTVVGIVADTRYRELTVARPTTYIPYEQGIPVRPNNLAVRTASARVADALREVVASEVPGAAVVRVTPLPGLLAEPLARPRFQSALTGAFALLGLLLSVIGTWGVLSFFVRQRTREIGIRIAIGAAPVRVGAYVLRQGMIMAGTGILIGTALAIVAGRLIRSLLFDVNAADPLVLSVTAAAIFTAATFATLLPTRLAARTDPMLVLRSLQ